MHLTILTIVFTLLASRITTLVRVCSGGIHSHFVKIPGFTFVASIGIAGQNGTDISIAINLSKASATRNSSADAKNGGAGTTRLSGLAVNEMVYWSHSLPGMGSGRPTLLGTATRQQYFSVFCRN